MRIPNSFVTRFTQAADLKLACVFYSLIHKNTKRNLLGYEITVKQSTLNTPIKNTSSLYNKKSDLSIGFKKKMRLSEIFFLKRGSG